MNDLEKEHLHKRLSQLHEQRLKELSLDDDLGMETGYVTDSSINSRKGNEQRNEQQDDQTPINKSRKTKSERDKRRSSRVSLLDSKNDSGSENSSESATEEKQPRYRKRAGSKRVENGVEGKENVESRRKRAGSGKNLNRLSIVIVPDSEEVIKRFPSTTTLQMNNKDIYSGTWNAKERSILDQVLNNIDVKSDNKKSFMGLFKRGKSNKPKDKNINKIEEEDNTPVHSEKYPLNQYYSDSERHNKKHKIGLFRKIKETVKQHHEEALLDKKLQHYMPSPSQKKKGLLGKFVHSKKKDNGGRHRAHSSNDYARCVGVFLPPESEDKEKEDVKSNLSKGKSGSFKNLFSSTRAKSVDNLNGAFEYYANPKQVFQRTPSMSKLNSRVASMEKIDLVNKMKRSASQKSLDHAFEPVQFTAKELCYDDPLVYAQARFMQPQKGNERITRLPRQISSDGYGSAYEEDLYQGYQSDVTPSRHQHYQRFTFENHPQHAALSDSERTHSAMSRFPPYYPQPPPRHNYYAIHQPYQNHPPPASPYFIPTQHAQPLPGYYTPGYATPAAIFPHSGYETPCGYMSESDYAYVHHSPHFLSAHSRPPPPMNQQSGYVAYQSRKAVQRSVSKNSSASNYSGNYGYGSESSFCDDEIYSMVQPGAKNTNSQTNSSRASKTSQLSTDV